MDEHSGDSAARHAVKGRWRLEEMVGLRHLFVAATETNPEPSTNIVASAVADFRPSLSALSLPGREASMAAVTRASTT